MGQRQRISVGTHAIKVPVSRAVSKPRGEVRPEFLRRQGARLDDARRFVSQVFCSPAHVRLCPTLPRRPSPRNRIRRCRCYGPPMPTILALFLASAVHAQAPDDGLDLARLAGSECGPDCSVDEVAAIRAVCLSRCRGCRTSTAVRRVSPRFFAGRTVRRHWLGATRAGTRPPAWPIGAPPWEAVPPRLALPRSRRRCGGGRGHPAEVRSRGLGRPCGGRREDRASRGKARAP